MALVITGTKSAGNYNSPIYGLCGKYTLSEGVSLPYFLSALPIERAVDELKTAEQIPVNLNNKWSLHELFQREVDRTRVNKELVRGYLADPSKLKFFNALTVVLMPRDGEDKIGEAFSLAQESQPIPWIANDPEDAQWVHDQALQVDLKGLQYVTIGDSARLRWDPDLVHAVAVDGQHRLVALQEYRDEVRARTLTASEKETRIPVIFVLIHPAFGFTGNSGHNARSVRALSRELFTDLNKNAKPVDHARELILDDWSISARAVRTLVTNETATDDDRLLPLSLVRWQDDRNRFDTSYYINSLVHLELVVESVLEIAYPRDPMDKAQVKKFIKSINSSLGTNGQLVNEGTSLETMYDRDFCDEDGEPQTPMSRLPQTFLDAAVAGFVDNHQDYILRILTQFRPYRQLLSFARQHDLITGVFGQFHAQTSQHRAKIKQDMLGSDESWYDRAIQNPIDSIQGMKGSGANADWSFKAIFQKALIRLARTIEFECTDRSLGTITDLLKLMDYLHERELLRVGAPLTGHAYSLWTFVATNPVGGTIKVAQKTEDRILALLQLWYYANRKHVLQNQESGRKSSAAMLLRTFASDAAMAEWPGCKDAVEVLEASFSNATLLGDESDSDRKHAIVRKRLVAVVEAGLVDHDANDELAPE